MHCDVDKPKYKLVFKGEPFIIDIPSVSLSRDKERVHKQTVRSTWTWPQNLSATGETSAQK